MNRALQPAVAPCVYRRGDKGGHGPAAAEPHVLPWVPDEPEPPGGWPAAPDAMPCVVSEWVLTLGRGGLVETRPVHSWLPQLAANMKDDGAGHLRARRFAAGWATLAALAPSGAQGGPALCRGCVRRLLRAGVLLELPTRRGGGNHVSSRPADAKPDRPS
jgi:hypothetical protein